MSARTLVVYSRPRCHLCDEATAALRQLLEELRIGLEVRNVETEPEWERRFGEQVPVGFLDDRKIFKFRVDPARIRRALSRDEP